MTATTFDESRRPWTALLAAVKLLVFIVVITGVVTALPVVAALGIHAVAT